LNILAVDFKGRNPLRAAEGGMKERQGRGERGADEEKEMLHYFCY
jgi:hypothetical protein